MTKALLPLLASLTLGAIALPANAASQDDLRNCKAQLVLDGHVDDSTDTVRMVKIKRKAISLEITEADDSKRTVTCKIRKGRVVGLTSNGKQLTAKAVTRSQTTNKTATN